MSSPRPEGGPDPADGGRQPLVGAAFDALGRGGGPATRGRLAHAVHR